MAPGPNCQWLALRWLRDHLGRGTDIVAGAGPAPATSPGRSLRPDRVRHRGRRDDRVVPGRGQHHRDRRSQGQRGQGTRPFLVSRQPGQPDSRTGDRPDRDQRRDGRGGPAARPGTAQLPVLRCRMRWRPPTCSQRCCAGSPRRVSAHSVRPAATEAVRYLARAREEADVVTAIVLIRADVARIPETAEAIAQIPQVSEVYSVTGEFDLVAMVRVRAHEELSDVIPGTVNRVAGVTHTETHIAFRTYSRHDLEAAFALGYPGAE